MISYYVGKSINVSNSHLLKDGNAMLYISLGIERWYQRYSDCYLRLATKKVTEIDDDLCVIRDRLNDLQHLYVRDSQCL